jgi:Kef-type K+ transport system membrane component KefB
MNLPLKDPVAVFALILVVLLLSPLLLRKIRVPSIVGLILSGVLIGPKGLGILELDSTIKLFGTIGLLYIMFLAGLEIDFRDFLRNARKSVVFGFLTFSIPLCIGTITTFYYLHLPMTSSLLLASMYATHTLISYPIVSRLGVTRNEAVTITVGGTIITDTAALLMLSFITASVHGTLDAAFLLKMLISLAAFGFIVMYLLPRAGRWFFRNVESEGASQFIFTLFSVFFAAWVAELAGIEPIIGAFLAGLSLNRLIPHSSPLMNRTQFVGNALFIPIFLMRVGMIVDLRVLFGDWKSLNVAATILVVAYATKWLAAYLTQQIFKYKSYERNLIFGLGSSHAAATLAIILIGFDLKLFDESILNGTILMILVTCLVSTFITENAAKKIALADMQSLSDDAAENNRILIPVSNPNNFEQLIDLALMLKDEDSETPIFPLTVVTDEVAARRKILSNNKLFGNAISHANAAEVRVEVVSRLDLNVAGGILRAAKELLITDVVIGWNGKVSAVDFFFGSIMTQLLQNTAQTVWISKIQQPVNTFRRLMVVIPPNAHLEVGFPHWLAQIGRLMRQLGANAIFFIAESEKSIYPTLLKKYKPNVIAEIKTFDEWDELEKIQPLLRDSDLLIVTAARKQTISYHRAMERLPKTLSNYFEEHNFAMIYPEQNLSEV